MPDADINALHAELLVFFQRLRETRDGRPVFAIEYLGSGLSCEDVLRATRPAIQETSLTNSVWWGSRYLPLLVAATEVGYTYRGNGTTYWPELAKTLGVEFTTDARQCLKDFFRHASHQLGFAQPKPSPWVNQFSYIAWPISHAILPEYMQERFAQALTSLRVDVETLNDSEEIDAAFMSTLTEGDFTSRFGALVRNSELSATLARAILGTPADSWLDERAVERIKRDIDRSSRAQASVEAARLRQAVLHTQLRPAADVPALEHAAPAVVLVVGNPARGDNPYLSIRFPISARNVASRITEDPRTRFFAPSLWSIVPPIRIDALLCGQDVPLPLDNLPSPATPLFTGFDPDLLANNAFRYLQGCTVDLQRPLLFGGADGQNLELLNHLHAGPLPSRIVVIDEEGNWESCSKNLLGTLCNHPVYELDLTAQNAVERLTAMGLTAECSLKIDVSGTPPLESSGSREYAVGDVIVFTGDGPFDTLEYDGVNVVPGAGRSVTIGVAADPDGHAFTASRIDGTSVTRTFCASSFDACPPLVEIKWQGGATTDALLQRIPFVIHIRSSLPLASVPITVSLATDYVHRVGQFVAAILPLTLTERHEVWDRLVSQLIADDLSSAGAATVEIAVGGLCHATFNLHRKATAYWWTEQLGGDGWSCETDGGKVNFTVTHERSPLKPTLEITDPAPRGIVLFLPQRPLRDIGDGLCDGGTGQAFDTPTLVRQRFVRQIEDTSNGVGLQRLFSAYLNWTLARSTNGAVNFRRRALVAVLDNWTAAAVCGEAWAAEEVALPPFFPSFTDHLAISLCAGDYLTLAEEIRGSWSDVDLWVSQLGPTPFPNLVFLERAIRAAVFQYGNRNACCSIAMQQRVREIDLGQIVSEWKIKAELHHLVATVWPTSGHGSLVSLPYNEPDLQIMCAALHRWHQEYRDGNASLRWDRYDIQGALSIWLNPVAFKENPRWGVLSLLRDDMGMARAIRYAVLRMRFLRC
jgi:hypothetical protein